MGQRHSKMEGKEEKEKVEASDARALAPKQDPERAAKAGPKPESEPQQPEPGPDPDPEKPTTTMTPTQAQPPAQPHAQDQSNPTSGTAPSAPETPSTDPAKDARETAAPSPQLPAPSQVSPYTVPCSSADNKGCPAGEYCTNQNVCTPMLADGMACSSNMECASTACQAAVCVAAASAPPQSSSLNLPLILGVVGGLLVLVALLYLFCKWYERRVRKRGAVDGLRRDPAEAARAALGKPVGFGSTPFGCAAVPAASGSTASITAQLNDPAVHQAQHLQQQGLFYVDSSGTKSIWNYPHGPSFPQPSMSSAYSTFPVDDRQAAAYRTREGGVRSSATNLPISTRAYDRNMYTDGSYVSPAIIGRVDPLYTADVSQSAKTLRVPDSRAVVGPWYSLEDNREISLTEYARDKAAAATTMLPSGSRPAARENLSSGSIGTLPEGEFYPTITPKGLTVVNASKDDYEVSVISAPKSPVSALVSPTRSTPWNENDAFASRDSTLTLASISGEPQVGTMSLVTSETSHHPVRVHESDCKPRAPPSLISEARYQAPEGENVAPATFFDPSTPPPLPSFPTYDARHTADGRLESGQNARGDCSGGSETPWR